MAVTNGPNIPVMTATLLGDSYLADGNKMLRMLQALVQPVAISKDFVDPSLITPVNGDRYIVGTGGTGAWSGHDADIAYWTTDDASHPTGVWEFYTPKDGWMVFLLDPVFKTPNCIYVFITGSGWTQLVCLP